MIYKVFCLFDSKVEAYLPPRYYRAKGEAIREFSEAVNMNDNGISKYPGDFTLFEIGEFDDSTGFITMLNAPVSIGNGLEFKRSEDVA